MTLNVLFPLGLRLRPEGFLPLLLLLFQPPAGGTDLKDLPLYEPAKDKVRVDWLIRVPKVKARLYRTSHPGELVLSNGLVRRIFRTSPNGATVALDDLVTGRSLLRAVKPEALVWIDGRRYEVGGLKGQPDHAFLEPAWLDELHAVPGAFQFVGFQVGKPKARIPWKRVRHYDRRCQWPPSGVYLRMDYEMPHWTEKDAAGRLPGMKPRKLRAFLARCRAAEGIRVSVHYELYDGVPILSKWITLQNGTKREIVVSKFRSELLAAVEDFSCVQNRGVPLPHPNILAETEYAFGGGSYLNSSKWSVHWTPDPEYRTQVNYLRKTPCLLQVGPELGPAREVAPGGVFESFRAFLLPYDTTERERMGLEHRRLYRTLAPWVTENPLMMHVRRSDWKTVKRAIDQCADVGFEMVILSFGSGFNMEREDPAYLAKMKSYADYARSKGIGMGGYSLLASRRVGGGNDVVMPEGMRPAFGNSPCLQSEWGRKYFAKLYRFFERTGFTFLVHDGNYPGDVCASTKHPGHKGLADSRWKQWKEITDFYKWCRGRGIYLDVPDYYYLAGSNKCGMGYRETNWSLPRALQVIHTRQNIFDGTWEKTPSMGWMFVPLTQYHGGGAAATIEPLHEHLDHYERMVFSNLSAGVQAVYRGVRLYDTRETRDMLARWVAWYKRHREVLESDLVHLRRADARFLDGWLHVNPFGKEKGLLALFNPLDKEVTETVTVPLYYTGLTDTALVSRGEEKPSPCKLDREYKIRLTATIPARGFTWYLIR